MLPRDEHVVKDNERLLSAILSVSLINVTRFECACVTRLTAIDVGQTGCCCRDHANDGVVLIALKHVHGGHDANPVRVETTRHVSLGTLDVEPRIGAARDVHEEVWIRLLAGAFAAITLGICHTGTDNQVVGLCFLQEVDVALVIGRAVLLIDIVGNREQHAQGVEPSTALKTGTGELAHAPLHLIFLDQIFSRFGYVEEAVNLLF